MLLSDTQYIVCWLGLRYPSSGYEERDKIIRKVMLEWNSQLYLQIPHCWEKEKKTKESETTTTFSFLSKKFGCFCGCFFGTRIEFNNYVIEYSTVYIFSLKLFWHLPPYKLPSFSRTGKHFTEICNKEEHPETWCNNF